ncbi:MAG TPA: MFS transporter, partial [Candidatus Paenibacillus intestinavium]|nr:MFS transporter [Candidatus Paenibacillus intestinavium]
APEGVVPQSVVVSFYVGAVILIFCSLFTVLKVKEYSPAEYAAYHGIALKTKKEKVSMIALLRKAPKIFWTISLVQLFCWMGFQYLWTYGTGAIADNVWNTTDASSAAYQTAGNWFGILSAVQAIAAVIWSLVLSRISNDHRKIWYALSLFIGAIGFGTIFFIENQGLLLASFFCIGIAWAGMMMFPFTMLTNALSGENMGTYLGLFNSSICIPQIIASCLSFALFPLLGASMPAMLLVSGVLLVLGSISVVTVKETYLS